MQSQSLGLGGSEIRQLDLGRQRAGRRGRIDEVRAAAHVDANRELDHGHGRWIVQLDDEFAFMGVVGVGGHLVVEQSHGVLVEVDGDAAGQRSR